MFDVRAQHVRLDRFPEFLERDPSDLEPWIPTQPGACKMVAYDSEMRVTKFPPITV